MMKTSRLGFAALLATLGACRSSTSSQTPPASLLQPGEVCDPTTSPTVRIHFDPPTMILAPGQYRPARIVVDPDMCAATAAALSLGDPSIAEAPTSAAFDLRHPASDIVVHALATGSTSLTVALPARAGVDSGPSTGALPIEVRADDKPPSCGAGDSSDSQPLAQGTPSIAGKGALANASLSVPQAAFARTDELAMPPLSASIGCASDLASQAPRSPKALGPAVSFTPQDASRMTKSLRREIDFAIPVNPAAMPSGAADAPSSARMRHLQVLYSGPRAKTPRAIPVASPRFERLASGDWVMRFSAPWFGTYQATVAPDAGTRHRSRHLTHRAVVGFSMGAGGAAMFGLRHHDRFDAVGPMGGPSDWNWLLWFVDKYALGGFCPAGSPNCTKFAPNLYPLDETYAHTEDYEHWWYQDGSGNGGHFPRGEYVQIFEDLALMQGNPNGQNADGAIGFLMPGPKATDPFVHGTVQGADCSVTIEPISGDTNQQLEQQIQQQCQASRCEAKNQWVATSGFYNAEYNPDGSKQVISYCDGGQNGTSPYDDTWAPPSGSNAIAVNMSLVVDLNKNGVRDQGEPVIRMGHEPYGDTGTDGIADEGEPGYDAATNPDPNQDDYDFALNPAGTENDHRWEQGEPFQDWGLDGVKNTPQQPGGYDVGEGDGKFTMAAGLASFYANDAHGIVRGWSTPPAGALDDAALSRIDIWSDGGVRDLFNFAAVANHLEGAISSRGIKSTAFYNGFGRLPGADPTRPHSFLAADILWADTADAPSIRYGDVDASQSEIAAGDGQHVGTGEQILYRLVSSFYFAASKWPDAPRELDDDIVTDTSDPAYNAETTTKNELGVGCEIKGRCEKIFTGPKTGRTGPIAITLPPGYALEATRRRDLRYPVLFVLHGYGQDPRDLEATAAITNNYWKDAQRSSATRLAKFIVVYVDGRCRIDPQTGAPECIRGTFYMNSNRTVGGRKVAQLDDWFDEVIDYIDDNYRTMGAADVDVVQ